jgi:hypothetical protein
MQKQVRAYEAGSQNLMRLASQLLALRDLLEFRDEAWEDALTDHITTLDSAATFAPQSELESQQFHVAVRVALNAVSRLIQERDAQLS